MFGCRNWKVFLNCEDIYFNLEWPKNTKIQEIDFFFAHISLFYLFLIDWLFLYNIGLISVIYRHELAIGGHMSPPSCNSCPPSTLSHPSGLLGNPSVNSLSHWANFHWLSILYMLVYMLPCYSPHSSLPFLPRIMFWLNQFF